MSNRVTKRTGKRVGENISQKKLQNSKDDDNSLKKLPSRVKDYYGWLHC